MKTSEINSWTKVAITMFFIGIVVLIISLVIFAIQYFSLDSIFDSKVASELGGYISGFVGVFWTGVGAILVYATFQEQKKLLIDQQFQSSYFKLLDTYNFILSTIKEEGNENKSNKDIIVGKSYFAYIMDVIKKSDKDMSFWIDFSPTNDKIPEIVRLRDALPEQNLNNLKSYLEDPDNVATESYLRNAIKSNEFYFAKFDYFFNKYRSRLEPYCRFISNILKYVEEENSDKKVAEKYLKILWSQMTEEELVILFYYAKSKESKDDSKFLTRLKKYNFLGNVNESVFFKHDHKKDFC